jgi:hypothetical protein
MPRTQRFHSVPDFQRMDGGARVTAERGLVTFGIVQEQGYRDRPRIYLPL